MNKLHKDLDKMSKSDLRFICLELGVTISGNKSKKQLVNLLLKPLKRKYKMKNYFPAWNSVLKDVKGCNFCLQKLRSEGLLASTSNNMAFGANLNYDRLWKLIDEFNKDTEELEKLIDEFDNDTEELEKLIDYENLLQKLIDDKNLLEEKLQKIKHRCQNCNNN